MMVTKMGHRRYAAEGSPADCVLAGLHDVLKDNRPDLILSGVNRGNNSAENALYSGTLGAAIEGALQRIPSIALSQYLGPQNYQADDPFEAALTHGAPLVRRLLPALTGCTSDYRLFFNVNFPPVPADQVRGAVAAPQGYRRHTSFKTEPHLSPSGRKFLWIKGGEQHIPTAEGSDAAVNLDGFISVTPMRADLTCHDSLGSIAAALTDS